MAIRLDTTIPRDVGGGQTGVERVAGFTNIRTTGIADMARKLILLAQRMGASDDGQKFLDQSAREASKPLFKKYKENLSGSPVGVVTGNLKRSVKTQKGKRKIEGVGVAVTGPSHKKASGGEWDIEFDPPGGKESAGNHAWLVEFGTGRRRPGTQGRRTLVNLHDKVNSRFSRRPGVANDEQFARMSKSSGVYFIMGSKNTPGRKHGSGYPHDFLMAIGPGETYGAMPAKHPMERAIESSHNEVQKSMTEAVRRRINALGGAA